MIQRGPVNTRTSPCRHSFALPLALRGRWYYDRFLAQVRVQRSVNNVITYVHARSLTRVLA